MFVSSVFAALAGTLLVVPSQAGPIAGPSGLAALVRRDELEYEDCDDDQKEYISDRLDDVAKMAGEALTMATNEDYVDNLAYKHYFNTEEEDDNDVEMEDVEMDDDEMEDDDDDEVGTDRKYFIKAMTAMKSVTSDDRPFNFKIRCGTPEICPAGSLGFTNYFPEDVEDPEEGKGVRTVTLCEGFFNDEERKRRPDDESFCEDGEDKKFKQFETGAHTLMHELTHLDSFGKAIGLPLSKFKGDKKGGIPEVEAHGTDDYQPGSTRPRHVIARSLLKPTKTKPPTFKNAENYAAAATEQWVLKKCGIKDVPV